MRSQIVCQRTIDFEKLNCFFAIALTIAADQIADRLFNVKYWNWRLKTCHKAFYTIKFFVPSIVHQEFVSIAFELLLALVQKSNISTVWSTNYSACRAKNTIHMLCPRCIRFFALVLLRKKRAYGGAQCTFFENRVIPSQRYFLFQIKVPANIHSHYIL